MLSESCCLEHLSHRSLRKHSARMSTISAWINMFPVGLVLLAGLLVLLRPYEKKWRWLLLIATCALSSFLLNSWVLLKLSQLTSIRYDLYFYSLDRLMGSPSFVIGRLIERYAWLHGIALVSYELLFSAMLLVIAAYFSAGLIHEGFVVTRTLALNLALSLPLYLMVPVAGPRYTFSRFPHPLRSNIRAHVIHCHACPNGFPSIHTSSALAGALLCTPVASRNCSRVHLSSPHSFFHTRAR